MKSTITMILLTTLIWIATISARTTTATRHLPATTNSNTLQHIIHSEKRFILYNSRRLTGECLSICQPSPKTVTTSTPTKTPTAAPVNPTNPPTAEATSANTGGVQQLVSIEEAATECACESGDDSKQSFKCGNDVYVCPGITEVCSTTGSQNSKYYKITQQQCDMMRYLEIDDKCLLLSQYGMKKAKGLSNRVCYDGSVHGMKVDAGGCDSCTGSFEPKWETENRR